MKNIFYLFITLSLLSHTLIAATYEGQLDIVVEDDFIHHHSVTSYFIHADEKMYPLHFPKDMDISLLATGDNIIINTAEEPLLEPLKGIPVQSFKLLSPSPLTTLMTDDKNVLTLFIDFNDKKASDTTSMAAIEAMMYTDEKSMNTVYRHSSFDQLSFISDTNNDAQSDIYPVNLNYSVNDTCEAYQWRDDAKAAIAQNGVDISAYQYFVIVLPNDVACGWGGLGNLGCNGNCTSWIKWNSTIVYAHELGHNLGMHHASTDLDNDGDLESEYGDHSGVMGNNGNVRQINAPHRYQLEIYHLYPEQLLISPPNGRYSLSPLELNPDEHSLHYQVIKLPQMNNDSSYYLSFRRDIGSFGMAATYSDKVNVHHYIEGNNRTHFITALSEGETFTDEANNIDVEIIAIDDNTATIDINSHHSLLPQQVIGHFERTPISNTWHQVDITYNEDTQVLEWNNAAGYSWELTINEVQLLAADSPYGERTIEVEQANPDEINSTVLALWFLGERYQRIYTHEQIIGDFQRDPVENTWHEVTVFSDKDQQLWWQNKAGVQWELFKDGTNLYTLDRSPYGYQLLLPEFNTTASQIEGLWFKNEFYQRMSAQE